MANLSYIEKRMRQPMSVDIVGGKITCPLCQKGVSVLVDKTGDDPQIWGYVKDHPSSIPLCPMSGRFAREILSTKLH